MAAWLLAYRECFEERSSKSVSNPTQGQWRELLRRACDGSMSTEQHASVVRLLWSGNLDRRVAQGMLEGVFPGVQNRPSQEIELASVQEEPRVVDASAAQEAVVEPLLDSGAAYSEQSIEDHLRLKSVRVQARILREHFRGLDTSFVEQLEKQISVPECFDGLAVVPKYSVVKSTAPEDWPGFNRALHLLLEILKGSSFLKVDLGKAIGPQNLCVIGDTRRFMDELSRETPGDCLVFPVQTGRRYAGKSPLEARAEMTTQEFGLDPFIVGCLLLTHPRRLQREHYLYIDCPGAEYMLIGERKFMSVPVWRHAPGGIRLGLHLKHESSQKIGSATGFKIDLGGITVAAAEIPPADPRGQRAAQIDGGHPDKKKLLEF